MGSFFSEPAGVWITNYTRVFSKCRMGHPYRSKKHLRGNCEGCNGSFMSDLLKELYTDEMMADLAKSSQFWSKK